MGAFGPNFGPNFAGFIVGITIIPTKKVTVDLCVKTNVTEDLCI